MHDATLGRALVSTARCAIGAELGRSIGAYPEHPALDLPGATFVTLFRRGDLRGCIGSLHARRTLREDCRINAIAAAFADPRFPPLADEEFDDTAVEISLLSQPERLPNSEEAIVLGKLRPGIDGVILEFAGQRATFLPQVWESLPSPEEFLSELKRKAGLPANFWCTSMNVSRYGVTKWKEKDLLEVQG